MPHRRPAPLLSACVRSQWHAGVHDFYGKGGAGTDSPLLDSLFFWDENHPWDRTGHRWVGALCANIRLWGCRWCVGVLPSSLHA